MQNAVYLLLRMVHRAVVRCPPCPPLLYGPVCVHTDPSLSCPSKREKTHTHTHTHTHTQVSVKVKVSEEVMELERVGEEYWCLRKKEITNDSIFSSLILSLSLSLFLSRTHRAKHTHAYHSSQASQCAQHSTAQHSTVQHSTSHLSIVRHSTLTCSTRVTSG